MSTPKIVFTKKVSLRDEPGVTEATIEDAVVNDPSILGLGPLAVLERQRRQERAGVLDLLLEDNDQTHRFEVELMLGRLDESHIIRTIEYWDIERRRYPGYEHVAVVVAEDITSRFLNVLSLFSGTIPLVVLQLWATRVDDTLVLAFIKILDQRALRVEDTADAKAPAVERSHWIERSSEDVMKLVDEVLGLINSTSDQALELNYKQQYVGLRRPGTSWGDNFVLFRPRKAGLQFRANVADDQFWADKLTEAGLDAKVEEQGRVQVLVTPGQWKAQSGAIAELVAAAVEERSA